MRFMHVSRPSTVFKYLRCRVPPKPPTQATKSSLLQAGMALSTVECYPLPDLPARDGEDTPGYGTAASSPRSTSSRTDVFSTPTPSKLRRSSTQKHMQELLTGELHNCKQQLELCKQQLESANTKAALAEAEAEAAEAAAAAHKARAAELHAKNLQLEAQLKTSERALATSQRAMAAIRSAIEWAQRPVNSMTARQCSS